jgi:Carboxypeptidase regulatory-like domain
MENPMRRVLTVLALGVVVWAALPLAMAQKVKEDPNVRSVEGTVTDASGAPAGSAVVYLKNTKTLQVRTFNTRDDGSYVLHGLNTNIDYELKAERSGASSDSSRLSTFDSRKKAVINLKLKK